MTLDVRWLGVFRLCLGTLLVVESLRRWNAARAFYSNDGLLPNHFALFAPMGRRVFSIYNAFSTYAEVSLAFALTTVVFVLFTLGYKTKLSHVLSAICITSLNARNLFVENGGTIVVNLITIWTLFLPLGRRFSVDAVLATLRTERESSAADLNERSRRAELDRPVVRLAALALILQWSVIYFFNTVHKSGKGWMNGSALHWFLHQDRIVTAVGIWVRENVPFEVLRTLTYFTLGVEGTLAVILLIPFGQTGLRRLALLLALGLHGSIALFSRLGPFSYVMVMFFVLLLGRRDWALVERWFARPARARSVIYDSDCGICFQLCRLLKRLDPFERLTFVGNDETARVPDTIDPALLDRTVVVVLPDGSIAIEERAVFEIGRALPFGILGVWWLAVPGLSALGRRLYRWVATHRHELSAWLGYGQCGVGRRSPGAAAASAPAPASHPSKRDLLAATLRELLTGLLLFVAAVQVAHSNAFARKFVRVKVPVWAAAIADYPRIYQPWGMFAPEPPYQDGRLVVDGRTVDGRKLDPLTGEAPEFDPHAPDGWGHDQFWCDYHLKFREASKAAYRGWLTHYLLNLHVFTGRPEDRLEAFEVWWVEDDSPPPGTRRGKPRPPQKLLAYGRVSDSGAARWLEAQGASRRSR